MEGPPFDGKLVGKVVKGVLYCLKIGFRRLFYLKLLGKVPIEPAYAEFADQGEFDKVSNPYLDGAWEALYELERERQKKESGETAEA